MAASLTESQQAQCLRRAYLGDRDALARVFEHHRPFWFARLRRMGISPDDAEDLLQNLWFVIMVKAPTLSLTPRAFWGYFTKALRSMALDFWKSSRRRETPIEAGLGEEDSSWLAVLAAPSPDPQGRDDYPELFAAIDTLTPSQAALLQAHYFEGDSLVEWAARTGLPLGTVKSHHHYAKKALRARLAA